MRADRPRLTVVPPLAAGAAAAVLAPPRLPLAAVPQVTAARSAGPAAIPVLLSAPAAAGRLQLARALHSTAGRTGPLMAVTGRRPLLTDLPAGATLYVDVAALGREAVTTLEAVLDDATVWVLAACEPGVDLPATLAPRLSAIVIAVPPLRARLDELPALAAHSLASVAARTERPVPRLSPAALAQLASHPWIGDLLELDAVLARALLASTGTDIALEDLGIGTQRPAAPGVAVGEGPAAPELELMLAELAHELRNPLVTIKTFAGHLPALMEDAELRARFRTLCDEAVERMDGLLENVLGFARLGTPHRQPLEVPALLDRVVAELGPELAGRSVRVERPHQPGSVARCSGDPEHLAFALRNLLAGVAREMPARQDLVIDAAANGVVSLRFTAGTGTADRLRRLVGGGAADAQGGGLTMDPTLLPLAFRLARSALERGGGSLEVGPDGGDAAMVVVRLPTAPPAQTQPTIPHGEVT